MSSTARRLLWTVLFLLAVAAPVAWTLVSARTEPVVRAPLAPEFANWQPVAIPLTDLGRTVGGFARTLRLRSDSSADVTKYAEVDLHLLGDAFPQHFRFARLEIDGINCSYDAPPGSLQADGSVRFLRSTTCSDAVRDPGDLLLTTVTDLPIDLSIAALLPPDDLTPQPGMLREFDTTKGTSGRAVLRGVYVYRPARKDVARIDLLSYVWQVSSGARWLWTVLTCALVLLAVGAWILPTGSLSTDLQYPSSQFAARGAMSAACFAGALALCYVVLVPPLQAADEPDHLLSYAQLTGNGQTPAETATWARLGHLQRIRFTPTARFRPQHVGNPYPVPWGPEVYAGQVAIRSRTATTLWSAVHELLGVQSPPRTLLALRLANATIFALTVGLASWLMIVTCEVAFPQLLCAVFLLVPTLPFFATHVSETAPLVSAEVLFAAGLCTLVLSRQRSHWAGLPLGLSTAVILASGRGAWPMMPFVLALLLGRIVLSSTGPSGTARAALIFWGGFVLGLSTLFGLVNAPFLSQLSVVLPASKADIVLRALGWVFTHPALLLLVLVVGPLLEVLVRRAAAAIGPAAPRWHALHLSAVRVATLLIVVSLVASLVASYPVLSGIEGGGARPPLIEYTRSALVSMLGIFRLSEPDYLLFSSFWGGFGWLDAIPPRWFLTMAVVLSAACTVGLLHWIVRTDNVRATAWLLIIGAGAVASLVLYTIAAYAIGQNLHGRYLIGWHLCVFGIFRTYPALAVRGENQAAFGRRCIPSGHVAPRSNTPGILTRRVLPDGRITGLDATPDFHHGLLAPERCGPGQGRLRRLCDRYRVAGLFSLVFAIHVYCLCFIIMRYF